jgi:hypothetical protein
MQCFHVLYEKRQAKRQALQLIRLTDESNRPKPENIGFLALTGGRGGIRTHGTLPLRQINPTGKISLFPKSKSPLKLPPSCPQARGVGHRYRTLGWDVVDAAASCARRGCRAGFITCERSTACRRAEPKRTAKSCGPDASVVGVKSCGGAKGPTGLTCRFP